VTPSLPNAKARFADNRKGLRRIDSLSSPAEGIKGMYDTPRLPISAVLEIAIQTAPSRRGVSVVVLPGDIALRAS